MYLHVSKKPLIHFQPMFHFYTGDMEVEHWLKMGERKSWFFQVVANIYQVQKQPFADVL